MFRPRSLLAPARYSTSRRLLKAPPTHYGLRRFSIPAASADGSLPLDGYRVLDMTRVLAGVGAPSFTPSNTGFSVLTH
jgi:hypothetical protein